MKKRDASIRAALQDLYERDGKLEPEVVLYEAQKEGSPLRGCFDWDDANAAHEHRLDQARALIRWVRIEIGERTERVYHVPAAKAYYPASVVVREESYRVSAVRQLLAMATGIQRRADDLLAAARAEGCEDNIRHVMDAIAAITSAREALERVA